MDPNNVLAQQQSLLNQAMQNAQHMTYGMLAFYLAGLILTALVIYAFYARLRGIEDEIRKFRIAYEFAHTPATRAKAAQETRAAAPSWPEPPKSLVPGTPPPEERKYMPK